MKNIWVLMISLILSVSGKSQSTSCIYVNGIGGYSTKGNIVGISVGYYRGYLIEFSGYANPNSLGANRDDTKSPFLLMVRGGYGLKLTDSWTVATLAGVCRYYIQVVDYNDIHHDLIWQKKLLPVFSPRIMYTLPEDNIRCFKAYVGVTCMKYSPAIEIGFTIDLDPN